MEDNNEQHPEDEDDGITPAQEEQATCERQEDWCMLNAPCFTVSVFTKL